MSLYTVVIVDYGTLPRTLQYIQDFVNKCDDADKASFVIIDNYNKNDRVQRRNSIGCTEKSSLYSGWHGNELPVYNIRENTFLIATEHNLGYAKANNIGALFSNDIIHSKYVLFSNNDIKFPKRFSLKTLSKNFELHTDCFMIGPEVLGLDGKRQGPVLYDDTIFDLIFRSYSIAKIFKQPSVTRPPSDFQYGRVHHVVGCFMLTDIEQFIKVGMFDENTFLYFEENILSERAKAYHLYYYYDSFLQIIHEGGGTVQKKVSSISQDKLFFESACYYCREYKRAPLALILLCKLNFHFFYIALKNIKSIFTIIKKA